MPTPDGWSPEAKSGASIEDDAPDRTASNSMIAARLLPLIPPNGSTGPSRAAFAFVVGLPSASNAQSGGIVSPAAAAFRMRTHATALDAWSIRRGGFRGRANRQRVRPCDRVG